MSESPDAEVTKDGASPISQNEVTADTETKTEPAEQPSAGAELKTDASDTEMADADADETMAVEPEPETAEPEMAGAVTGSPEKQTEAPIDPSSLFEEALNMDDTMAQEDGVERRSFAPLLEQRDQSLKELLLAMDEYAPIIPDAVTDYYLARAGFETNDVRIKRLLALATQKFVSDIATDAFQFSRIRAQSGAGAAGSRATGRTGQGGSNGKISLTMEDLSSVLTEFGLNIRRPDFFR